MAIASSDMISRSEMGRDEKGIFRRAERGKVSDTPDPIGVSERKKNSMSRSHRPQAMRMTNPSPPAKLNVVSTMKSAFEATEPYILTELGKQFVHYAMTEIVPRIGSKEGKEE